jgi:hypothetical protein
LGYAADKLQKNSGYSCTMYMSKLDDYSNFETLAQKFFQRQTFGSIVNPIEPMDCRWIITSTQKNEMGLPKKNFEKKISFPRKCVEVWVFDGT